jgi:transcriptional regulator with XRE-family HTH domain
VNASQYSWLLPGLDCFHLRDSLCGNAECAALGAFTLSILLFSQQNNHGKTHEMTTRQTFALLLDQLIRDSGFKGVELANTVGLKPTSISGWRHGRDIPDGSSLRRVIEALSKDLAKQQLCLLIRAWLELHLGQVAKLAWDEREAERLAEKAPGQELDSLLWRWSAKERGQMKFLLQSADEHLEVREALLAFAKCLQ